MENTVLAVYWYHIDTYDKLDMDRFSWHESAHIELQTNEKQISQQPGVRL